MEGSGHLLSELYDIKRQNTDWEIKLEDSSTAAKADTSNQMQIIVSSTDDVCADTNALNCFNQFNNDNRVEIFVENNVGKGQSWPSMANDGIKNVEQYVERRKMNGITWYYCKWQDCRYGSNKSNHLVRHIRTHTGEKPYECNWPDCGKKFTDSWKRKDHELSHTRKLMASSNMNDIVNYHLYSSSKRFNSNNLSLITDMFDKSDDISTNNEVNHNGNQVPIIEGMSDKLLESNSISDRQWADEDIDDENNSIDRNDNELNMFIPEVIVSEIDVNSNNQNELFGKNACKDGSSTGISAEDYVEKSIRNDRTWYSCKWPLCSYSSYKSHHMMRHIRSHTNEKPFRCDVCGKCFADLYKKKDHQLTHNRKFITSVQNNNLVKVVIDMNQRLSANNDMLISINQTQNDGHINYSYEHPLNINKLTLGEIDEQIGILNTCFANQSVMSIKHVEPFVERRKIDNITWYFCKFPNCTYGSNKSNHLVRHIKTHANKRLDETRPYVCQITGCFKKFTDASKLKDHQLIHEIVDNSEQNQDTKKIKFEHPSNGIVLKANTSITSIGGDVVMSIKNVEQYVERRKVNGITFYFCKWPLCNYGSNKSNHLVRHVRTHTNERPFTCDFPQCLKKFTDAWKLRDHKMIHMKKNNFANHISGSPLVTQLIKCANKTYNNDEKTLAITDGSEQMSVKEENLEIEDKIISDMDMIVPDVNITQINNFGINSGFNSGLPLSADNSYGILSIKNVEQYVDKTSKNDSNWYSCKWPNCRFETQKCSYIVQHVYKHTGEKPYKCNWNDCSAKFNKKLNLTLHMMSHTGEKPLRCHFPMCYYAAVTPEALEVHIRRHTGERPYSCDWIDCDAKFASRDELMKHAKSHVGDRFYHCHFPDCTYASKYRNKLTIHIRRHTNDRPFKCRIDSCGKSFIVSDKLRRHEIAVHGILV